jgi:hypothetical protein
MPELKIPPNHLSQNILFYGANFRIKKFRKYSLSNPHPILVVSKWLNIDGNFDKIVLIKL